MGVKINIQQNLQYLTNNQDVIEVDGSNVGECLEQLVRLFPDLEKELSSKNKTLLDYVVILINGKSAYPNESARLVKDGDEITVMLMIAGG